VPRTPHIQLRAAGYPGQALIERTAYLNPENPGPALAETARTVIAAWAALMDAELQALALGPDLVDQLTDVMNANAIDGTMLEGPRTLLLGEIEDCLDDATGKPAYPELLAAAQTWTPAQGAAIMDALWRLRARAQADPGEGRSKALRAVGLR
jgi:hypothetical protein